MRLKLGLQIGLGALIPLIFFFTLQHQREPFSSLPLSKSTYVVIVGFAYFVFWMNVKTNWKLKALSGLGFCLIYYSLWTLGAIAFGPALPVGYTYTPQVAVGILLFLLGVFVIVAMLWVGPSIFSPKQKNPTKI